MRLIATFPVDSDFSRGEDEMEIRRTNGQCPYGSWLAEGEEDNIHGEIPTHVYAAAEDDAVETGHDEGTIEISGQTWEWRSAHPRLPPCGMLQAKGGVKSSAPAARIVPRCPFDHPW